MGKHFSQINVGRFRGLKDLSLPNLKQINVLLGDNNSGKTTLLEAIRILCSPSFNDIVSICNQRTRSDTITSYFSSLINAFPRDEKKMSMRLSCLYAPNKQLDLRLTGQVEEAVPVESLIESKEQQRFVKTFLPNLKTVNRFFGNIGMTGNGSASSKEVIFSPLDALQPKFRIKLLSAIRNVSYLDSANFSGFVGQLFRIGQNEKYKTICIEALRLFDESIEDILLLRDDLSGPIECIKSSRVGTLPITSYGDGVQKVVAMAEAIAMAHGGILLIDEFETGIHARNYNDIFNFLLKACLTYDIQLFVTTHSLEAIDELLKIDEVLKSDQINFITIRKDQKTGKTLSRTLTPQEVKANRASFDFEVRL